MNKQTHFPSIIATLTSVARTRQLFARKKELNYYSTKDIDKTILPDEFLTRLPITKFILNDVLSSTEYKSLKPIAKSLGFAFVWFDFSKAFDTVSPTKLLKKLKDMGFSKSALIWIKSYLEDRKLHLSLYFAIQNRTI